ncbi:MAG: ABC transporter ATP-binding protein [Gammaproteobacteria bacterium]|nr:ABC transporter ATP-binding protein [Gammaproteobacteria bacterium]
MLELDNLTAGYGDFLAVQNVSLRVSAGTVYALLGANGAGKTSTIMTIAGHVGVMNGRVLLDGRDITGLPAHRRTQTGMAVAPEGRRLFADLSVEENLILGGYAHARGEEPQSKQRVYDLFPRLQERATQRAGTLSGGEQQMLAIGRALMAKPLLLMIDELSLGLMPKAVDLCYEALAALKAAGMTILLVEQNTTRALEVADDVCVLESGRIAWSGTSAAARGDSAVLDLCLGMK